MVNLYGTYCNYEVQPVNLQHVYTRNEFTGLLQFQGSISQSVEQNK